MTITLAKETDLFSAQVTCSINLNQPGGNSSMVEITTRHGDYTLTTNTSLSLIYL